MMIESYTWCNTIEDFETIGLLFCFDTHCDEIGIQVFDPTVHFESISDLDLVY